MKAKVATVRLPDFVEPMKARLVDSIPPGAWIYEIKFDGYRALALRGGKHNATPFPERERSGQEVPGDSQFSRCSPRSRCNN